MTERLLQYIWQFQYFNKGDLSTSAGEDLHVVLPGNYNTNQGPDFLNAQVRIGRTTWAGSIELHLKTSDWDKHQHTSDPNYKNVILHVVWEKDAEDKGIPQLEIRDRVPSILLQRYEKLLRAPGFIPCDKGIHTIKELTWKSWKERLLAERLLRKAHTVETYLQQNNYHWEETLWWLLARNFGIKVNAEAFEALARSIPLTVLAKHKNQIHQLEALLLGQAGLLNEPFEEDYPRLLQREYRFLQAKYLLQPIHEPLYFLRMRPGNFPTIRLAQLAMLVHHSVHLFSRIRETGPVKELRELLTVTANDYWHYHYRPGELSAYKPKTTGAAIIDNIIINTIAPVLFAYGNYHKEKAYKEKAIDWLEKTPAEKNSITRGFIQAGIAGKNAYDSQALIELKSRYCNEKRCLDCSVGNALLNKA